MDKIIIEYLKEIKEARGSFYLEQVHKQVTYDAGLTDHAAMYLQRFIELELYITDKELETDLNQTISKII